MAGSRVAHTLPGSIEATASRTMSQMFASRVYFRQSPNVLFGQTLPAWQTDINSWEPISCLVARTLRPRPLEATPGKDNEQRRKKSGECPPSLYPLRKLAHEELKVPEKLGETAGVRAYEDEQTNRRTFCHPSIGVIILRSVRISLPVYSYCSRILGERWMELVERLEEGATIVESSLKMSVLEDMAALTLGRRVAISLVGLPAETANVPRRLQKAGDGRLLQEIDEARKERQRDGSN